MIYCEEAVRVSSSREILRSSPLRKLSAHSSDPLHYIGCGWGGNRVRVRVARFWVRVKVRVRVARFWVRVLG